MRPVVQATLLGVAVAGTLDILSAFGVGALAGRAPLLVLRGVASGPFGTAVGAWNAAAAAVAGLGVHFAIMACMVTAYVVAARRSPTLVERPWLWGALYGLCLYLLMYWLVLPLRFPKLFPQTAPWPVANALFSHVVCVGIPIALITAAVFRRSAR